MQNTGIAALGLNWRYLAFDVRPDHLLAAIQVAKCLKFVGLNLTVPHKVMALQMVDELDESARNWGAVNTIRFEARNPPGEWQPLISFPGDIPDEIRSHGFNTDAEAIARALSEDLGVKVRGARVLLLGAGGAGRVTAMKLASEGEAEELAVEIRARFSGPRITVGYPKDKVDLVLNATSLGLNADDGLPVDESHFSLGQSRAVYDMIYRPAETPLLKAARTAGCRTANGLGMLLYQGAHALEIWSGMSAPVEKMRRALEKEVYGR